MAYDPTTKQTVLFGGQVSGSDGTFLGDTWIWNGGKWAEAHPQNSPSPRFGARSLAYDGANGNLVLFGGSGGVGPPFATENDTWTWDGSTWHQDSRLESFPGD